MFLLKGNSLLAFDKRRKEKPENLYGVFSSMEFHGVHQVGITLDPFELYVNLESTFLSLHQSVAKGETFDEITSMGAISISAAMPQISIIRIT